jgi:Domain of unknown function (DUF4376)
MKEFFEIDEDGNIIENYLLNPESDDIPPNFVEGWAPLYFYKPKYNWLKSEWYEGDPEGALKVTQEGLCSSYANQREEILARGFEYKGDMIPYDSETQQQFMMALMNLTLRPTTSSVTIFMKDNTYKTYSKAEFFEMYDMGESLKVDVQDKYEKMQAYINSLQTLEEVEALPRNFEEALELLS